MERPLCRCHGLSMDRTAAFWQCAEKRRARQRAAYHKAAASDNYARTRRALRARIQAKRLRIAQLKEQINAQENTG